MVYLEFVYRVYYCYITFGKDYNFILSTYSGVLNFSVSPFCSGKVLLNLVLLL
jgi:hypothetical protein